MQPISDHRFSRVSINNFLKYIIVNISQRYGRWLESHQPACLNCARHDVLLGFADLLNSFDKPMPAGGSKRIFLFLHNKLSQFCVGYG